MVKFSQVSNSFKKQLLKLFYKKAVLNNLAILIGKHLCWSLFLIQASNFITKRLQHRCFPVNIAKFLKTSILKGICERLLLNIIDSKWKKSWRKQRRIQRRESETYSEPSETSKMKLFAKNSWLYLTVDYFWKTLHITCFTGLWMCLDKTK